MKTLQKIIILSFLFLTVQSCDKIEMPYKQNGSNQGGTATKKVLLEDYTGHLCVNCPTAGKKALELQDLYEGKVIVIGVHAGYFSTVQGAPFDDDFNCEASTEWDDFFGVSVAGNPNGIINRMSSGGSYVVGPGDWSTKISGIIEEEAVATVEIGTTYNADTRKLDIDVQSELLSALDGNYKLQVCIVEDSIIGAQKNNDINIGAVPVIMNYVHRHVMRQAVNTSWGTDLVSGGAQAVENTPYTQNFSLTLNSNWNDQQCYVVAWLYNAEDYSIIQVEEKRIR